MSRTRGECGRVFLWNPTASVLWSLVFSPIFGAYVQAKNWELMGEPNLAKSSRFWVAGCAVFFLVSLGVPDVLFGFPPGLASMIAWYLFSGKRQVDEVGVRFGDEYGRLGWGIPLAVAAMCVAVFSISCIVLLLLLAGGDN